MQTSAQRHTVSKSNTPGQRSLSRAHTTPTVTHIAVVVRCRSPAAQQLQSHTASTYAPLNILHQAGTLWCLRPH